MSIEVIDRALAALVLIGGGTPVNNREAVMVIALELNAARKAVAELMAAARELGKEMPTPLRVGNGYIMSTQIIAVERLRKALAGMEPTTSTTVGTEAAPLDFVNQKTGD